MSCYVRHNWKIIIFLKDDRHLQNIFKIKSKMLKTKFIIFLKDETDNCVTAIIKYTESHANIMLDALKSSFLEARIFFHVTSLPRYSLLHFLQDLLNFSTPNCLNFLIEIRLLNVDLRKIAEKIGELFHFDAIFLIIDIHLQQSIHSNPLYKIAKGTRRKNAVSILPKHHQSRNAQNINPYLMVFYMLIHTRL